MAIGIVDGNTVDLVPLHLVGMMEERAHLRQIADGLVKVLSRGAELSLNGFHIAQEIVGKLGVCHLQLRLAQSLIELHRIIAERSSPHTHIASIHHIAQLLLVGFDLRVGRLNLDVVQLGLHVELALLGNVARGYGDVVQHTRIITDGAQADFKIVVNVALRDDALRANPQVLDVLGIYTLAERRQLKQVGLHEEFIIVIAVEVAYIAHHLVRVNQPAIRGIERQADDGIIKDKLESVGQLVLPLLLLYLGRFVLDGTDNVPHPILTRQYLGYTDVVKMPPLGSLAIRTDVPAIGELGSLQLVIDNLPNPLYRLLSVVRMHMLCPLVLGNRVLGIHLPVKPIDAALTNIIPHNVVAGYLYRLGHHARHHLRLLNAATHPAPYHTVSHQYAQKQNGGCQQHERG